jgi:hypothetical protein
MKTITKTALFVFAILGSLTGACGQTSYFEVSVAVKNDVPAVTPTCLFTISHCSVTVSGADSYHTGLLDKACHRSNPTDYSLGAFQYATDKDSGVVTFTVEIQDGNLKKLGDGTASGAIIPGGRQTLTVGIEPDAAAFNCI